MENASKALIMAGSVLISLVVIGALLLMFNNLSAYQQTDRQTEQEAEVIKFNNEYEIPKGQTIRGSDLYSLLNKAIDYNRRQTTAGTGTNEGQDIAFTPLEIWFTLNGKAQDFYGDDGTTTIGSQHLINNDGDGNGYYGINAIQNTFTGDNTDPNSLSGKVKKLEEDNGGSTILTNLVTAYTKIFIDAPQNYDENNHPEQKKAVLAYKSVTGKTNPDSEIWSEIKPNSPTRKAVLQYYEYVQFKRAKFKCSEVDHNQNTGRVTSMKFEFTGRFE